jgi:hypothetical protein
VIDFPPVAKAWTTRGQMKAVFAKLREIVGEVQYLEELEHAGVHEAVEFVSGAAAGQVWRVMSVRTVVAVPKPGNLGQGLIVLL